MAGLSQAVSAAYQDWPAEPALSYLAVSQGMKFTWCHLAFFPSLFQECPLNTWKLRCYYTSPSRPRHCIHMGDWVEVLDKEVTKISPDPLYYLFTQQTLTQALLLGDLNPGDPVVSSRQKTCKVPTLMEFYWGDRRQAKEPICRLTSV